MNDAGAIFREMSATADFLRACIDYTARQTGFRGEMIEKDFVCSAILDFLSSRLPSTIIFKGGTCLSKVYTDFYRLSEDLDFAISLPFAAGRSQRRKHIEPVKNICDRLMKNLPGVSDVDALRGANQSTQYSGTWGYQSIISGSEGLVGIEFGLREPALLTPELRSAATLVQNAVTGKALVPSFRINVMALPEIMAEKTRAALTRREPAIRDFFDLDYALLNMNVELTDATFVDMIRKKLAVPKCGAVNLSFERRSALERQVDGQLRPVLRPRDFDRFDLQRIWDSLVDLAARLKEI